MIVYFKKIVLFFFISLSAFSQQITIEKIKTNGQILTGRINEKYNITLYLSVSKQADDHLEVHTYKGWYYYDNVKKKIPLVGIYSIIEDKITLYNLSDKKLEDKIKNFTDGEKTTFEKEEAFSSLSDYNEKFVISSEKKESLWTNKNQEFKLEISQDYHIRKEFQFLRLDKKTVFDLDNLDVGGDLKILHYLKTKNETRILLTYEYAGNINMQGRCGGAVDSGYVILSFNDQNDFSYKEELATDECGGDLYSEEIKSYNKDIIKLKINGRDFEKIVSIDTKSISFIKGK